MARGREKRPRSGRRRGSLPPAPPRLCRECSVVISIPQSRPSVKIPRFSRVCDFCVSHSPRKPAPCHLQPSNRVAPPSARADGKPLRSPGHPRQSADFRLRRSGQLNEDVSKYRKNGPFSDSSPPAEPCFPIFSIFRSSRQIQTGISLDIVYHPLSPLLHFVFHWKG